VRQAHCTEEQRFVVLFVFHNGGGLFKWQPL